MPWTTRRTSIDAALLILLLPTFAAGAAPPPDRPRPEAPGAELYQRVRPGVVMITTRAGAGSGFLIGTRRLVTNFHVVAGGRRFRVVAPDGDAVQARVLRTDKHLDLALLELPRALAGTRPLQMAGADPHLGDGVMAVGNPLRPLFAHKPLYRALGLTSWSVGVVTNVAGDGVQFSAPVHPGSSGGPLLDTRGEVIGVVKASVATGLGFAVRRDRVVAFLSSQHDDGLLSLAFRLDVSYLGVLSPTAAEVPSLHGIELLAEIGYGDLLLQPFVAFSGEAGPWNLFRGDRVFERLTSDLLAGAAIGYFTPWCLFHRLAGDLSVTAGLALRARDLSGRRLVLSSGTISVERETSTSTHAVLPMRVRASVGPLVLQLLYAVDLKSVRESQLLLGAGLGWGGRTWWRDD